MRARNFFLGLILILLAGCAESAPVPGGTDAINQSYFTSKEDFLSRVNMLEPRETLPNVLSYLGVQENQLQKMNREELIMAMMGTNNMIIQNGIQNQQMRNTLQYLQGYRLNFKSVAREHGFTSPIRWRTDESGYDYTVTMIFYNGTLMEKPVVSGGQVNNVSSKTLFDFLNPGTAIGAATP